MEQDTSVRQHNTSFYLKRITGLILLLAMAAVFLFSGISKLYSFERFEWNIMDAGISSMTLAAILARLFIGFELLLGVFLLAHLYLQSFTYPAVIGLLLLFTVYLALLILRQGDSGNCGCFGDAYAMRPSMAMLKNLVMIGITILISFIYRVKPYKNAAWVMAFAGMTALVLPFIFYPLSGDTRPEAMNEPINLAPLYHSKTADNRPPFIDLRTGKHIVAFMSLTCPHCRKAAFLLQIIHRQHPELPIFMVLNGHPDFKKEFFEESKAEAVPHMFFRGGDEFQSMAGPAVPAIYWINNSVIERKSSYFELDPVYMKAWLEE